MQRAVGIADVCDRRDRPELGAQLVTLAGLSVFLYGAAFSWSTSPGSSRPAGRR